MSIGVYRVPEGLVAHVQSPTGTWYARKHDNGMLSRTYDHRGPWVVVKDLPIEVFEAFWKFGDAVAGKEPPK